MKTKIVLLCAGGASTSILMKNIKKAALLVDFDCEVNAYSVSSARRVIPDADIVLIAPQIRYTITNLQETYPDKEILVIDMLVYGTMDGEKIIEGVTEILGIS